MERTLAFAGDCPLLLIAPHGSDDVGTDTITEKIADKLNCYAVINKCWRRAKVFDYWTDHADLNHIPHCLEEGVVNEFLDPILEYKNAIVRDFGYCQVFTIHGFGYLPGDEVEAIIGYGDGEHPRHSCKLELKDAFAYLLEKQNISSYCAKSGYYAANGINNLNQLFTDDGIWYPDDCVQSMQIELCASIRKWPKLIEHLARAMNDVLEYDDAMLAQFAYKPKFI
jgi:hypothetical protein